MIKERSRNLRIAQEIKKKVAGIIQCELRDFCVDMITVSGVEMSRDLSYAKIFVTFLNDNDPEKIKISIRELQNTTSFIRNLLGKKMHLRVLPKIKFAYDSSVVEGMRLNKLITQIAKSDYVTYIE